MKTLRAALIVFAVSVFITLLVYHELAAGLVRLMTGFWR
jgi:hypothetical protein